MADMRRILTFPIICEPIWRTALLHILVGCFDAITTCGATQEEFLFSDITDSLLTKELGDTSLSKPFAALAWRAVPRESISYRFKGGFAPIDFPQLDILAIG